MCPPSGGAEAWLAGITSELNDLAWMGIAGDNGDPILTRRGTRPGSSFADITFGVLLKRILNFRHHLRGVDTAPPNPVPVWNGERTFAPHAEGALSAAEAKHTRLGDIIWADDLASCIQCDQAEMLPGILATGTGCVADAFAQHGLTVSYGPETAAICVLRGPQSRAMRRNVFGSCSGKGHSTLCVLRESQEPDQLPLVFSYRHLGVLQNAEGSIRDELQQRVRCAWAAFREGRRKVYKCRQIRIAKRTTALQGLVLSKLVVGAGSWPPLNDREGRLFQTCLASFCRQLLCLPRSAPQHFHWCSLCARTGMLSPTSLLHVERLRYVVQLVGQAPDELWALLRKDRAYCDLMLESLAWLHSRINTSSPFPDPTEDWSVWVAFMRSRPAKFRGWMKRAIGLQRCSMAAMAAHVEFRQEVGSLVGEESDEVQVPLIVDCIEVCITRKRAFYNLPAWASHAARIHGYRAPSTRLTKGVTNRTCPSCGRVYATQMRLKRHLDNSPA